MKNNFEINKDDFQKHQFEYSPYLKRNIFFQWYKKYFHNKVGIAISGIVVLSSFLLLFFILSIKQSYLLPNKDFMLFLGLNKQIQQIMGYGYEQQAKEWSTFVILSIYNILCVSLLLFLYGIPRIINFMIKSWVYHKEDRDYFLTKIGLKDFSNSIAYSFLGAVFSIGILIAFTFFSVDDPALPVTTIYMFYPGISLLPYFIIGISSFAIALCLFVLINVVFIEFPCLIIGHFRYKDYEKKMQEGKVKYTMQTFYEEEMQENITPPPKPKDKWDNYDGLWND